MKTRILFLLAVLLCSVNLIRASPTVYNSCVNITSQGQFALGSDISGANLSANHALTAACILISESNVELDCLGHVVSNEVTGQTVSGNTTGIIMDSDDSDELVNVTVKNCRVSNYTWGITAYRVNDSVIRNNSVRLSENIAIELVNSTGVNVTNNTAYLNYGDGFSLFYSYSNVFEDNIAYDDTYGFVLQDESAYNTFENNLAYDNYAGFYISGANLNVFNVNTAHDNTEGFYLEIALNNTFDNNTAHSNEVNGFFITQYSNNNTLTNNTAHNNTDGFHLETGSSNNTLSRNTAYNNTNGFMLFPDVSDNTLANNTAYGNGDSGFYITSAAYNTLTNNTAFSNILNGFSTYNSSYNTLDNNSAWNNSHGFFYFDSTYNLLTNSIAVNNSANGFELYWSSYNNLTNNAAHHHQNQYGGYVDYATGFYLSNSTYNILSNNTAYNNNGSGFVLDDSSNYNNITNNSASNNSWTGLYLYDSHENLLTDNNVYYTAEYGINIYLSQGNNLTDNIVQESQIFDLYIDPLFWDYLTPEVENDLFCNNIVDNMTGSGDRPINYTNTTVDWSDTEASEIVLCNADGSTLDNITVHGSDNFPNNGIVMTRTEDTTITNSNSSGNIIGFFVLFSNNNNFTNNIADDDFFAGFAAFLSVGNIFDSNTQSGSVYAGFASIVANGTVFSNNTASDNIGTGLLIQESKYNMLVNNTVHDTAVIGTAVVDANNTAIYDDHYYANDIDLYVGSSGGLGIADGFLSEYPFLLDVHRVIFDNPAGDFTNYTNLSIHDIVDNNTGYAITWTTQPVSLGEYKIPFENKNINIANTSGSPIIDELTWHWTDQEASGYNETDLQLMKYDDAHGWQSVQRQTLNVDTNQILVGDLIRFSVFVLVQNQPSPLPSGGGSGCVQATISIQDTICPGNWVVLRLTDSGNSPLDSGYEVTLTGPDRTWDSNYTNKNGEVVFAMPRSGAYEAKIIGTYCGEYSFDYDVCTSGCHSDAECSDTQYCQTGSGACTPVGCPCGQIYDHSCHPYACCADADCQTGYACIDHICKQQTLAGCKSNSDCNDTEYCTEGACMPVQVGACGRIQNHAWLPYECCNSTDCGFGYTCSDHTCVTYRILTEPTGDIGTQHELSVIPEGSYTLRVVMPNGESKTINTNEGGHATFLLDVSGVYSVSLIKDEKTAANVTVSAVNKTAPQQPEKPQAEQNPCIPGVIIVIVLLAALVYVLYKKGR